MFKSKGKRWSQGAECGGKGNRMHQAGWVMKGPMNETEGDGSGSVSVTGRSHGHLLALE